MEQWRPRRVRYFGDKELAATHVGEAERAMWQLKNRQDKGDSAREIRKTCEDGSTIRCWTNLGGMDLVTIISPERVQEEAPEEELPDKTFELTLVSEAAEIDTDDDFKRTIYIDSVIPEYNIEDLSMYGISCTPGSPTPCVERPYVSCTPYCGGVCKYGLPCHEGLPFVCGLPWQDYVKYYWNYAPPISDPYIAVRVGDVLEHPSPTQPAGYVWMTYPSSSAYGEVVFNCSAISDYWVYWGFASCTSQSGGAVEPMLLETGGVGDPHSFNYIITSSSHTEITETFSFSGDVNRDFPDMTTYATATLNADLRVEPGKYEERYSSIVGSRYYEEGIVKWEADSGKKVMYAWTEIDYTHDETKSSITAWGFSGIQRLDIPYMWSGFVADSNPLTCTVTIEDVDHIVFEGTDQHNVWSEYLDIYTYREVDYDPSAESGSASEDTPVYVFCIMVYLYGSEEKTIWGISYDESYETIEFSEIYAYCGSDEELAEILERLLALVDLKPKFNASSLT